MNQVHRTLGAITVTLAALLCGCSTDDETSEHESNRSAEGRGEHDRDGGEHDRGGNEHGREGGEESGTELALNARYDKVRNGARLVLAYDAASHSFVGTVTNTTEKTLEKVRVEVHLSNGKELGPTKAADLAPGASREVKLTATSTDFERWNAHPEVGGGEHGGEGRGEHRDE